VASLCGNWWAGAERLFAASQKREQEIDALKMRVDNTSYAAALKSRASEFDNGASGREIFADISKRYRVCEDPHECDFAYVWASDPLRLLKICPDVAHWFGRLSANATLARGARLASLLANIKSRETGP
jgi:hypothetical protein